VTLFCNDHLGNVVYLGSLLLPLRDSVVELLIGFAVKLLWFSELVVVNFAEDEHHNICILLDRARFAQVCELRALIFPLLDGSR
jgi:hypothetical protein